MTYIVINIYRYRRNVLQFIYGAFSTVDMYDVGCAYLSKLGVGHISYCKPFNSYISNDVRNYYLIYDSLDSLENEINYMFIGFNPRMDMPLLN